MHSNKPYMINKVISVADLSKTAILMHVPYIKANHMHLNKIYIFNKVLSIEALCKINHLQSSYLLFYFLQ